MWIIYNTRTLEIAQKCHLKAQAKVALARKKKLEKHFDIDKYDAMRHNEWLMWKTLQQ